MKVFKRTGYEISTDKHKLDFKVIHNFLTNCYWSPGISLLQVKKTAKNSICFGVYHNKKQIGYARVITDYVRFAYLADVFIIEQYRGKGLSKWLMDVIMNHKDFNDINSWMLATKDAHGLYEKFGFKKIDEPERFMRRKKK
jgi:N-acetylglutamate synthase-like GNAT family acetyltransferase